MPLQGLLGKYVNVQVLVEQHLLLMWLLCSLFAVRVAGFLSPFFGFLGP